VVAQHRDELALNGGLHRKHLQVVSKLGVLRDDDSFAPGGVKLRPAGAPKNLHYVEHAKVDESAARRVVHLRPLDDDGVRGQVDAPREGGGRHEHLHVAV